MNQPLFRQRALLTLPQVLVLLVVFIGLAIAIDLNRRAQVGQLAGLGEDKLQNEVAAESTHQAELMATLVYVESDSFVAAYARNEAGYILPGEKRVVTLPLEAPAEPTPIPLPTPDPADSAHPWQAWWQLLTDTPLPTP